MSNSDGQWITWNGRHILIKDGQSKDEVVKQLAKKFIANKAKKQSEDLVDKKNREIKEHEEEAKRLNSSDKKIIFSKSLTEKTDYHSRDYEIMNTSPEEWAKKRANRLIENAERADKERERQKAERKAKEEERKKKLDGVDPKSRYTKPINSLEFEEWHRSHDKDVMISRGRMPLKDGGWKYVYKVSWVDSDKNKGNEYDNPSVSVYGDTVQEALDAADNARKAKKKKE